MLIMRVLRVIFTKDKLIYHIAQCIAVSSQVLHLIARQAAWPPSPNLAGGQAGVRSWLGLPSSNLQQCQRQLLNHL